jgi:dienelactone hydrolase
MHSETLVYEADGLSMKGQLFLDPAISGPRPAVLVFPEAFGLSEHALGRAERLAGLGYAALACDLHGERLILDDMGAVMAQLGVLKAEPARALARAKGGFDALLARPEVDHARVAAIGYCFGGTLALELARGGAAIVAAVGLHSGLAPVDPDRTADIKGKILACIGADDPSVDQAQRNAFEAEMRAAGADWQLHVYGGVVHSFTNPEADSRGMPDFTRYDAGADARSWAAMVTLFDEVFGK